MKNIYLNTQAYDKNITSSNLIANQNIIINENKNWNVNSSKKIELKCDNFDFPGNDNIKSCLENKIIQYSLTKRNTIEYLSIFIIEFAKVKYCIDTINQYQNIDFSLCLTESDIKSSEKITESTEYYSFVNEEICKYIFI